MSSESATLLEDKKMTAGVPYAYWNHQRQCWVVDLNYGMDDYQKDFNEFCEEQAIGGMSINDPNDNGPRSEINSKK